MKKSKDHENVKYIYSNFYFSTIVYMIYRLSNIFKLYSCW